jgi:hypothetical protein
MTKFVSPSSPCHSPPDVPRRTDAVDQSRYTTTIMIHIFVSLLLQLLVTSSAAQTTLKPGDLGQSEGTWPFANNSAKFSEPLRVLVRPLVPYVMVNTSAPIQNAIGEQYYGIAIDLWERVRPRPCGEGLIQRDCRPTKLDLQLLQGQLYRSWCSSRYY